MDQELQSALVPLVKKFLKLLTQSSFLRFGTTASLSLSLLLSFLLSLLTPRPLGISHRLVLRDVSCCLNLLLSAVTSENSQTCGRNRNNQMVYFKKKAIGTVAAEVKSRDHWRTAVRSDMNPYFHLLVLIETQ